VTNRLIELRRDPIGLFPFRVVALHACQNRKFTPMAGPERLTFCSSLSPFRS
jgi:hypothetical protein